MTSNESVSLALKKCMGKGLQEDDYLCGPASLQKAFRRYGVRIGQQRIADTCGSTWYDGTNAEDMLRGVYAFGFVADVLHTDIWNEALSWLDTSIGVHGVPCILCVRVDEAYDHWVCCYAGTGRQGDMVYSVFDPGNWDLNKEEYGHNFYSRKALLKYWRAPVAERDEGDLAYYGIAIYDRGKNK